MNDNKKEIERLQALIGRYMSHVISCEGTDFIGGSYKHGYISDEDITELKRYLWHHGTHERL